MFKNITIVTLILVILCQFGWGIIREAAGRSSFGTSVVRGSWMVFSDILNEKDPKKRDIMLNIAINETQKNYKYQNGFTDLFFNISDSFIKLK